MSGVYDMQMRYLREEMAQIEYNLMVIRYNGFDPIEWVRSGNNLRFDKYAGEHLDELVDLSTEGTYELLDRMAAE